MFGPVINLKGLIELIFLRAKKGSLDSKTFIWLKKVQKIKELIWGIGSGAQKDLLGSKWALLGQ